jgi:predicted ATPase with chaperone activity
MRRKPFTRVENLSLFANCVEWHSSAIDGRIPLIFVEKCIIEIRYVEKLVLHANARMASRHIRKFCPVNTAGQKLLEMVTDRLGLSARSYTRILKVARTIADLAGEENIRQEHLAEAIQCRGLDRKTR